MGNMLCDSLLLNRRRNEGTGAIVNSNDNGGVSIAELKLKRQEEENAAAATAAALAAQKGPRIRLLPHKHSLFCERKQRVCTAVGQLQELEVLRMEGLEDVEVLSYDWIRIPSEHIEKYSSSSDQRIHVDDSMYTKIDVVSMDDTNATTAESGKFDLVLSREDVGKYIGFRYTFRSRVGENKSSDDTSSTALVATSSGTEQEVSIGVDQITITNDNTVTAEDSSSASNQSQDNSLLKCPQEKLEYVILTCHGPVKPGPPRLLDFSVSGLMKVGTKAIAQSTYIGGYEGASEFWWLKVSPDGKRTQITEPMKAPVGPDGHILTLESVSDALSTDATGNDTMSPSISDPRIYVLTPDDIGCTLKAKCRPTRTDGAQGEIFTSTSSEEVID